MAQSRGRRLIESTEEKLQELEPNSEIGEEWRRLNEEVKQYYAGLYGSASSVSTPLEETQPGVKEDQPQISKELTPIPRLPSAKTRIKEKYMYAVIMDFSLYFLIST